MRWSKTTENVLVGLLQITIRHMAYLAFPTFLPNDRCLGRFSGRKPHKEDIDSRIRRAARLTVF